MSYIGTTKIGKMFLGDTEIAKAYLGTELVFQNAVEEYIVFKDANVGQICATQWGDGVGIKPSQAAAVPFSTTAQKNAFWNAFTSIKTTMTSFDELGYFTSVDRINGQAFKDNTVLTSIDLSNIKQILYEAFRGCTALAIEVDIPNLTYLDYNAFYGSGVKKVKSFGTITSMSTYGTFQNCTSLTEAVVPATLTSFGRQQFYGCSNLNHVIMLPTTPPTTPRITLRIQPPSDFMMIPASHPQTAPITKETSKFTNIFSFLL